MVEQLWCFEPGERFMTLSENGAPLIWKVDDEGYITQEPLVWTDQIIEEKS